MPHYKRREAREQWPHLFDEAGKPIAPADSSPAA